MKTPALQFILSLIFLVILSFFISVSETDLWLSIFIGVFIFIGIPVLILTWIEFGDYLRTKENASLLVRTIGFIFGVPQALFGLISLGIGLAIVLWVLYNTFIEQQKEYSGGFLTLGMSPLFIMFGLFLIKSAFNKNRNI